MPWETDAETAQAKTYLADLSQDCQTKAADWGARVGIRVFRGAVQAYVSGLHGFIRDWSEAVFVFFRLDSRDALLSEIKRVVFVVKYEIIVPKHRELPLIYDRLQRRSVKKCDLM